MTWSLRDHHGKEEQSDSGDSDVEVTILYIQVTILYIQVTILYIQVTILYIQVTILYIQVTILYIQVTILYIQVIKSKGVAAQRFRTNISSIQ